MEFTRSEAKDWARRNFRGLEGLVAPSFTPDLSELDEEGIRHDVRVNIQKGMFSILAQTEVCAMTYAERRKFLEIVCDEARGKALVSMFTGLEDMGHDIDLLNYFETIGGTHTLFGWPANFLPSSEEDVFLATKYVCDRTNIAVVLWPKPIYDFGRFHPSHFNPALVERICDIPNVIGIKAYLSDGVGKYIDIHHRVADKVLLQSGEIEEWAMTVADYGQVWAGPGSYMTFDPIPKKQGDTRMVKLFDHFLAGRFEEGMSIYWELSPILLSARKVMASAGMMGNKYMQWLTGGNGGVFRKPQFPLPQSAKDVMRAGVKAVGIIPPENEEEFYVGKINYEKGVRQRFFDLVK